MISKPVKSKKKPFMALNMIVKNEAHVILETLETILKYIDYYIIIDTGSTDKTISIIKTFFDSKGIPGEILEHNFITCDCHDRSYKKYSWFHFGWNRSHAFNCIKGKSKYIWVIDADDLIVGNLVLPKLTSDCYSLTYGKGFTYQRSQIFKNNSNFNWRYEGALHEYPTCDKPNYKKIHIEGDYYVDSRRLGDRNKDPLIKFQRDIQVLTDSIADEPNNPRYVFYLGQTYFDNLKIEDSIKWYKKRAEMGGWFEEVYYSNFRVAEAIKYQKKSQMEITKAYLIAHKSCQTRAEPLYELAKYNRLLENYSIAYQYANKAAKIPFPKDQILFLYNDVYDWKIWDELALAAYYIGNYQESYDTCLKLLSEKKFPKSELKRIEKNRDLSVEKLLKTNNHQILVLYIGDIKYDPEKPYIKLSKYLSKDYNIYIFGDNIDESGINLYMDNIILKNSSKLVDFIQNNIINIFIICKYINYFIKYKLAGIQNYIWATDPDQDLLLDYKYSGINMENYGKNLLTNLIKRLDGIITSTNHQKQLFLDKYELKPDKIFTINYGINPEINNITKTKNRFIYISTENTKIDKLLEYFELVYSKYTKSDKPSLLILIPKPNKINLPNHIKLRDLNKSDILSEISKSEFWFHPLDIIGSYDFLINIAILAQAIGCLPICSDKIGLSDLISDRGILLKKDFNTEAYKIDMLNNTLFFLENPEEKSKYTEAGIKWGKNKTWPIQADIFTDLFDGKYKIITEEPNIILYKDINRMEGYIFYKQLDSMEYDIIHQKNKSIEELKQLADTDPQVIGFNSVGYMKYFIPEESKLRKVSWFKETDGLYINTERYNKQDFSNPNKNKPEIAKKPEEEEGSESSEEEPENNNNNTEIKQEPNNNQANNNQANIIISV